MQDTQEYIKKLSEGIEYEDLVDQSSDDVSIAEIIRDAYSEGTATKNGIQTETLQKLIDNYAESMNRAAIAKSTGKPVRTPTQQYKGFAAEEHHKHTFMINAVAKGVPDYKVAIFTEGQLPDGSTLSPIDMYSDLSIWKRNHAWSKPMRTADYQSKMHNDASAYAKDLNNPQYKGKGLKFVGGSGQGVNDTVTEMIGKTEVSSDPISPQKSAELAENMKNQTTPRYEREAEKFDELKGVNLKGAIKYGAISGLILSTTREVIGYILNADNYTEDQFIEGVERIFSGTIEGGVRGGAIVESVHILGKMIGKEVSETSFEAVPAMVVANVTVDFAKDLYKCFITQSIDTDDLLCNTVNNIYSSAIAFGGSYALRKIGSNVMGRVSKYAFTQTIQTVGSTKTAAEIGATIGSPLGPIGAIVGSVIGCIIIGEGVKRIINVATEDAYEAYIECFAEVTANIEMNEIEKLYCFVDSMESISELKLSFKNLIPCYNLISDLQEYNFHKKALKEIDKQIASNVAAIEKEIDKDREESLNAIREYHQKKLDELISVFAEQEAMMTYELKDSLNTYVAASYMQYVEVYGIMTSEAERLTSVLKSNELEHSYLLDYLRYKNEVDATVNAIISEFIEGASTEKLMAPFIKELSEYMRQDEIVVGKQYISYEEALYAVRGGGLS